MTEIENMDKNEEILDTEQIPLKVEITNKDKPIEIKDETNWETKDVWEFAKMSDEDIAEAEESRNA